MVLPISWLYGLAVVDGGGKVVGCWEPQWELQKSVLQQTGGHLLFTAVLFNPSQVCSKVTNTDESEV